MADGLTAGAEVLADEMARNFGSEGGGVVGKTATGRNVYKAAPPGKFPGIRTGNLRNSIAYQAATPAEMIAYAGCAPGQIDRYGYWLEYGTSKMAARPWAKRSLYKSLDRIVGAIRAKAKSSMVERVGAT